MKIQGQYDNTHKSSLGLLNDNKEVDHLWNISGAVTQAKEHHQIPSKCRGLTIFVVGRGMFGTVCLGSMNKLCLGQRLKYVKPLKMTKGCHRHRNDLSV